MITNYFLPRYKISLQVVFQVAHFPHSLWRMQFHRPSQPHRSHHDHYYHHDSGTYHHVVHHDHNNRTNHRNRSGYNCGDLVASDALRRATSHARRALRHQPGTHYGGGRGWSWRDNRGRGYGHHGLPARRDYAGKWRRHCWTSAGRLCLLWKSNQLDKYTWLKCTKFFPRIKGRKICTYEINSFSNPVFVVLNTLFF